MYKTASINYQKSKNILLVKNFYNLMKPRVMSLVVFTALVGLVISKNQIDDYYTDIRCEYFRKGMDKTGKPLSIKNRPWCTK